MLWTCALPALALQAELPSEKARPNFVVFVLDDLSWHDLGAYGNRDVRTPHLDALAHQGLVFDNAFLTTSSCSASRASLLSGKYPHQNGATRLGDFLPEGQAIIPAWLRASGYYTVEAGKLHEGAAAYRQFDQVISSSDDSILADWIGVLASRPQDKPFLFWFTSLDPHLPYAPLDRAALAANAKPQPEQLHLPPYLYDGPGTRNLLARYYQEIQRADAHIGRIVQLLAEQNVLDNTYVFVVSDNGAQFPASKTTLLDNGIKTPLLVAGPGLAAGKRVPALVSTIDLAPTILDLAGLDAAQLVRDATLPGHSLRPLLLQPQARGRRAVYAEQYSHGHFISKRAVRTEDYLYIHNLQPAEADCLLEAEIVDEMLPAFRAGQLDEARAYCFVPRPVEELYAVKQDPFNGHNLALDPHHREHLLHMRHLWQDWSRESKDGDSLRKMENWRP